MTQVAQLLIASLCPEQSGSMVEWCGLVGMGRALSEHSGLQFRNHFFKQSKKCKKFWKHSQGILLHLFCLKRPWEETVKNVGCCYCTHAPPKTLSLLPCLLASRGSEFLHLGCDFAWTQSSQEVGISHLAQLPTVPSSH